MNQYTLYHGDCLDVLPTLLDASVDAIVTDPPYGQSNEAYDNDIACQPEIWRETYRVAAPGAVLLSFAGGPTYHRIASAIEGAGWKIRQMWGWVYRDAMIISAYPREGFDRLRPAFDPICYATKGKALLTVERSGDEWIRDRGGVKNGYSERTRTPLTQSASGSYPTSLVADDDLPGFEYFILSRTMGGQSKNVHHPNQKPLRLMRWLISKLPASAETILDPFAGSGTTGVAALNLGRHFIGIERDAEHFGAAQERIADAADPLRHMGAA